MKYIPRTHISETISSVIVERTDTPTPDPFTSKTADNIFPLYSQLLGRRIYVVSSKNLTRFVIRERNGGEGTVKPLSSAKRSVPERSRTNALLEEGVFAHGLYQFPRNAPGGQTAADRRDEWIIETSSCTDEKLLQIFVQLLAVPSLIAHRSAAGGFLGVSLPASLSASLLVVILLLDGSIANVNRLMVGRESIRLRTKPKKRFSGWRTRA